MSNIAWSAIRQSSLAALVLALNKIMVAIAIASLIFSGDLAIFLPQGIGLMLMGTALIGALMAILSGIPGIIAAPKTGLSPIFALLAVTVAGSVQNPNFTLVNVSAALLTASFIVGLSFLAIGQLRFGKLVRFIPYPVIGGFFAGFSFLLLQGGLSVASATPINFSNFFEPTLLPTILSAVMFGVTLFLCERLFNPRYVFVVVFTLSVTIFWLWALLFAIDSSTLQAWLLPIGRDQALISFDIWQQAKEIEWDIVVKQYELYALITLMAMIMLLFDISAIETFSGAEIDLDKELKRSGLANLIGASLGGLLSLQTAADTVLSHRLYGPSRFMVLGYCAVCGLLMTSGARLLVYLPSFIVGGVLIYLSLSVFMTWLVQIRTKLPVQDYGVIWAILVVMASVGILEAIALGLLLTVVIFVIRYSRFSVIKFHLSGLDTRSNVDRDIDSVKLLDENGQRIVIIGLQSSIFFGTAARLLDELLTNIDSIGSDNIDYIILDFKRVSTLDTSGGNILLKLRTVTKNHNIKLVFTDFSEDMVPIFEYTGLFIGEQAEHLKHFAELDDALEWCESQMLEVLGGSTEYQFSSKEMLAHIFNDSADIASLVSFFTEKEISADQQVFAQGDEADSLYFILSGAITINLKLPMGHQKRLKELHAGSILGEMAFYTGGQRSADAVAHEDSVVLQLLLADFKILQKTYPIAAGLLHASVVRLLAQRLSQANQAISALSR